MQRRDFIKRASLGALGFPVAAWALLRPGQRAAAEEILKTADPDKYIESKKKILEILYGGGDHLHADYVEVHMEGGHTGRVYNNVHAQTEYLHDIFGPIAWWTGDYGKGHTPPQHVYVSEEKDYTRLMSTEGTVFAVYPGCKISADADGAWINSTYNGRDVDWWWFPTTSSELAARNKFAFAGIDQFYNHLEFSVRQGEKITTGALEWHDLNAFMRDFNVGHVVIDYFPNVSQAKAFANNYSRGVVHRAKLMTPSMFKGAVAGMGYISGPVIRGDTRLLLDDDVVYANRESYGHRHTPIGATQYRQMAEDIVFCDTVQDVSKWRGSISHPEYKIVADHAARNIQYKFERHVMSR